MVKKKISVTWSVAARKQFKEILEYLNDQSPIGASIVFNGIISCIDLLPENPERFPPDALKANKEKSFRAFTVYHYRVTYRVTSKTIYIYRIRHTSREPLVY